ncbi:hypothetical protein O181_082653 [Austropuccinia psidii MF-1]|uniref:Uncharacterized protein n=1 Tax=Austropuccinia psidii MF-1 TaxID=1389203 RepID=A0A9Q3FS69_9BASI|nr:hypothetical protein [Austropuccinia psidii MF-1]
MEHTRASTSSQRLASTFVTLIESPEAYLTAINAVRTKSFPTQNKGNISVSVQELVYVTKEAGVETSSKPLDRRKKLLYSSEEANGPRKDSRTSEGVDTHVFQRTSPKNKSLVEKKSILSEDQKKELARKKDNRNMEAPQAFTSMNPPQKVPKKGKKAPKSNHKGKQKAKSKCNKTYPQKNRIPTKEKAAIENVFNMEITLMEFKNKEEERINHSFPKK